MKIVKLTAKENDIRFTHPNAPIVYGAKSVKQIASKGNISKYEYSKEVFKNGKWVCCDRA